MTNTRHYYFVKGDHTVEFIQQGYKITKVHSGADGQISREIVTDTIINQVAQLVKAGWEKVN